MGQVRRKVLVIDDDASVCAFVSKSLTARGIDVVTSSDPQDGVRIADAESPDLLLISLLLSNSNGLKVSKAVHAIDHLRNVPVVMLISYAGELDAKYTASIGIIDVFVKPLNEADFVSRTLALLNRYAPAPEEEDEAQADELDGAAAEDGFGREEDEQGGGFDMPLDAGQRETLSLQEHQEDFEPDKHSVEKGEEMGYEFDDQDDQDEGKKTDFGLPEEIEPDHYAQMPEKRSSSKKILVIVVACIMLAGIVIGAYFAKRYFSGSAQQAKPAPAEAPAAPAAEKPASPVETVTKEAQPAPEKPAGPAAPAGAAQEKESPVTAAPVAPEKPAAKAPVKPAVPEKPAPKAAEKPAVQAPAKPHVTAEPKTAKASSPAKPAAGGNFSVQVGIFEAEKNASALAEKLTQKGYAASVKQDASDPKKPRYRVLVGGFDTRAKAAVQAKAIAEKEGIKAFVRQN